MANLIYVFRFDSFRTTACVFRANEMRVGKTKRGPNHRRIQGKPFMP